MILHCSRILKLRKISFLCIYKNAYQQLSYDNGDITLIKDIIYSNFIIERVCLFALNRLRNNWSNWKKYFIVGKLFFLMSMVDPFCRVPGV